MNARGGSKHLTNQEIATTVGVSERQVERDLSPADGETRQMSESVDTDDVIDAEIVEDDTSPNAETGAGDGPRGALRRLWEDTGLYALEWLTLLSPVVLARRSTLHRMEMNAFQIGRDYEHGNPSSGPSRAGRQGPPA